MSRKLTLSVHRNGVLVDGPLHNRPVRRMPSGVSGAVYFGDVYPLHVGDYIDLADDSLPKSSCPEFVSPGEAITYVRTAARPARAAAIKKWYVESNRFGHYLVFDGTEAVAERLAAVLETSPLGLVRWGESYRAADDGYHYDWFARLDFDGSRENCLALVEQLLSTAKPAKTASPPAPPLIPSQQTCDHLPLLEQAAAELSRLALVEAQLAKLQEEHDALRGASEWAQRGRDLLQTKLATLETELAGAQAREKAATAELRKAKRAVKDPQQQLVVSQSAAPSTAGTPAGTDELETRQQSRLRELEDDSQAAQELAEEMEARAIALQHQLAEATSQAAASDAALQDVLTRNAALLSQVRELQREHDQEQSDRRRMASRPRRVGGLELVLESAFPRLVVSPESIDELEREFPNPRAVYEVLRRLDREDPVPLVRIRDDLFEVKEHLATGNPSCADMGRVYTRRLGDSRMCVFVHRKRDDKDQQQFFDRVAKRPLERLTATA